MGNVKVTAKKPFEYGIHITIILCIFINKPYTNRQKDTHTQTNAYAYKTHARTQIKVNENYYTRMANETGPKLIHTLNQIVRKYFTLEKDVIKIKIDDAHHMRKRI